MDFRKDGYAASTGLSNTLCNGGMTVFLPCSILLVCATEGWVSSEMNQYRGRAHFGRRMLLTPASPRALRFHLRQTAGVTQMTLSCFTEPAHPSLDKTILVSLIDGHERPSNLIGMQRWRYSYSGIRSIRGHGEGYNRTVSVNGGGKMGHVGG